MIKVKKINKDKQLIDKDKNLSRVYYRYSDTEYHTIFNIICFCNLDKYSTFQTIEGLYYKYAFINDYKISIYKISSKLFYISIKKIIKIIDEDNCDLIDIYDIETDNIDELLTVKCNKRIKKILDYVYTELLLGNTTIKV